MVVRFVELRPDRKQTVGISGKKSQRILVFERLRRFRCSRAAMHIGIASQQQSLHRSPCNACTVTVIVVLVLKLPSFAVCKSHINGNRRRKVISSHDADILTIGKPIFLLKRFGNIAMSPRILLYGELIEIDKTECNGKAILSPIYLCIFQISVKLRLSVFRCVTFHIQYHLCRKTFGQRHLITGERTVQIKSRNIIGITQPGFVIGKNSQYGFPFYRGSLPRFLCGADCHAE